MVSQNGLLLGMLVSGAILAMPPVVAPAQETDETPLELPGLPSLDLKPIEVAPEAKQKILQTLGREELEREGRDSEEAGKRDLPADSILQDVLDVIRKRGSVLDGSVVDDIADDAAASSPSDMPDRKHRKNAPSYRLDLRQRQKLAESVELILQAARHLEATDEPNDATQKKSRKNKKRSTPTSSSTQVEEDRSEMPYQETVVRLRGIAGELLRQLEPLE